MEVFNQRLSDEFGMQVGISLSIGLRFKGLFLYTGGVLFHVEWCIGQL